MLSVRYCGTFQDPSGYGQANRNFIAALTCGGVEVSTELVTQTPEKATYGWVDTLSSSIKDRQIPYKVKIIHLTPDLYPAYKEPGKYHIGHLFWETNQLPAEWVGPCNNVDEIWCASEQQAEMIRNSGVKTPIHWFPQPIDTSKVGTVTSPYVIPNFDGMLFYSIFQWIERKNPKALIQTFWKTFSGKKDVGLLLKTYRVTYGENEFFKIKEEIEGWKKELDLIHFPPIFLSKKLLTTDEMFRLHSTGDCFVNASRGEGWNIPSVEAMLMGKPLISINTTGVADYLPADIYYPCSVTKGTVEEQSWIPWYTKDMKWLNINEKDLGKHMSEVYYDKEDARNKGLRAQKYVIDHFSYNTIGQAMRARLEEIYRFL